MEVSFTQSTVFIDGTKIESVGNRYRFVWKKSVKGKIRIRRQNHDSIYGKAEGCIPGTAGAMRAGKVIGMLKRGIKFTPTQLDVMVI